MPRRQGQASFTVFAGGAPKHRHPLPTACPRLAVAGLAWDKRRTWHINIYYVCTKGHGTGHHPGTPTEFFVGVFLLPV